MFDCSVRDPKVESHLGCVLSEERKALVWSGACLSVCPVYGQTDVLPVWYCKDVAAAEKPSVRPRRPAYVSACYPTADRLVFTTTATDTPIPHPSPLLCTLTAITQCLGQLSLPPSRNGEMSISFRAEH